MIERLLARVIARLVTRGTLIVYMPSGAKRSFGDGSGAPVAARFTDRKAILGFLTDPDMRVGELFMEGRLKIEEGTIYDFLDMLLRETHREKDPFVVKLLDRARFHGRKWLSKVGRDSAKANVAHHYDLDRRLYDLFLDSDRQYSCAYFEPWEATLEEAQLAKKRHIVAKLGVEPGDKVLDIGSGWGGMALYISEIAQADYVLGVTLSEEQLALANGRAKAKKIEDKVQFALRDYRDVTGPFNRIVSVGMFEHVGYQTYATFFQKCYDLLDDDGVMLLHTIGQTDGPNAPNPWLTRYIFPGGYLPSLSEILPIIERVGFTVTDVEILRLHYAQTLRHWRNRFMARREEAKALYDERFCLMWEYYLAMCEVAFHYQNVAVFQLQLARKQTAVPLTRDYIAAREAALRKREAELTLL